MDVGCRSARRVEYSKQHSRLIQAFKKESQGRETTPISCSMTSLQDELLAKNYILPIGLVSPHLVELKPS